jgi:hypothetical protein
MLRLQFAYNMTVYIGSLRNTKPGFALKMEFLETVSFARWAMLIA